MTFLNKYNPYQLGAMLLAAFALGVFMGGEGEPSQVVTTTTIEVAPNVQEYEEQKDPALEIALRRAKDFEGFSNTPYLLYGQWHIGYGHSIAGPEYLPFLSREDAEELLVSDMEQVERELVGSLAFYVEMPLAARMVLLDMGYNMGVPRLLGFTYMLNAMQDGDWEAAAHEMIDSLYYEQVTRRASNNVMLILDLVGTTTRGSAVL